MIGDPMTRRYRVTFLNLVNGVKYHATIQASTEFLARRSGHQVFSEHLAQTAGALHDWAHYSTAEVSL